MGSPMEAALQKSLEYTDWDVFVCSSGDNIDVCMTITDYNETSKSMVNNDISLAD